MQRARHRREEPRLRSRERTIPLRSLSGARAIAWRAAGAGAALSVRGNLVRAEWDIAPHCSRPYVRTELGSSRGYGATPAQKAAVGPAAACRVDIATPCRRCDACLAQRRRLWSARARSETEGAPETWFGTLTFRPELQNHWLWKCREDAFHDGVDFDQLTVETQFAHRLRRAGSEARKYIARLRQVLPCPDLLGDRVPNWRYLLVAERHTQGGDDTRPHFHMLLHSIHAGFPVPLEDYPGKPGSQSWPGILEREWSACGFSKWRPVDASDCTYLCKYLSKDSNNRVRASQNYGAFDYRAIGSLDGIHALASIAQRLSKRDASVPAHAPLKQPE